MGSMTSSPAPPKRLVDAEGPADEGAGTTATAEAAKVLRQLTPASSSASIAALRAAASRPPSSESTCTAKAKTQRGYSRSCTAADTHWRNASATSASSPTSASRRRSRRMRLAPPPFGSPCPRCTATVTTASSGFSCAALPGAVGPVRPTTTLVPPAMIHALPSYAASSPTRASRGRISVAVRRSGRSPNVDMAVSRRFQ
mmetsp:Transcript_35/g.117  ORF Transcript_35/g.117 Transcript_35/m.117 type:complete len:200 (-) Transcript_35:16-615(-)